MGWPRAAALWSALGGAVALAFLFALGWRLTVATGAVRVLAALVPVSLLAFHPVVLGEATRAEVNSWTLAWTCGATWLFARIAGALRAGDAAPRSAAIAAAAAWGAACGLGLAHHLTSILISAPLTVALMVIAARRRSLAPRLALAAVAAALPAVASYGIIAWRAWHPARIQWALLEPSLGSVIGHLTGAQYRHFIGYFDPSTFQRELLSGVTFPFVFTGLVLLALNAARAKDPETRIMWWAMLAAGVVVTVFALRYGVHDPAPYFLPAVALGAAGAAPALAAIPGVGSRGGTATLAVAQVACLLLIVPWLRDGLEERRATLDYERTIRSMWSAIPPDTAIVSWADDRYHRLIEYQVLRGEKPALLIVTPDLFFAASMRRTIQQRFGADPLAGFRPPRIRPGAPGEKAVIERHRLALVQGLNARVRVPVILFDPARPIVFQLRKPWEPATPH
jgi:hypothetical protein